MQKWRRAAVLTCARQAEELRRARLGCVRLEAIPCRGGKRCAAAGGEVRSAMEAARWCCAAVEAVLGAMRRCEADRPVRSKGSFGRGWSACLDCSAARRAIAIVWVYFFFDAGCAGEINSKSCWEGDRWLLPFFCKRLVRTIQDDFFLSSGRVMASRTLLEVAEINQNLRDQGARLLF
ncbi:hypothetical protein Taro_027358 [Colocasia esculenta]|uniref:Uncharacterized protein n=1 Tax=Colocasia esculenta TaxID=4460 RepID=A0A843VEA8_COLES|nr:hypothetical protein [Colocasia esculenta]